MENLFNYEFNRYKKIGKDLIFGVPLLFLSYHYTLELGRKYWLPIEILINGSNGFKFLVIQEIFGHFLLSQQLSFQRILFLGPSIMSFLIERTLKDIELNLTLFGFGNEIQTSGILKSTK